ncbi:acetyl-CoA hydrolase/transferase C-terminal domain-containing protein [Cupriavidus sp. 2SB]|uniref:acetyl-CoA hydrolase/transferase family protein n=1 Tax=Cupriavidus sp. 2SB TaxID=2502199 RepID=UPI0010F53998|nr:acetyl-CoA hydrolase/transferase C-terminal domain-containing protein [Cupriavidus sp. 2SB]
MEAITLVDRLEALIRPGDAVWWGQATAEPLTLTRTFAQHRHLLARDGRLRVFVGIGNAPTLQPQMADVFDFFGYAASGSHRALAEAGVLDILPCHYSHLPDLIRTGTLAADVALIQVSFPDNAGRYSLGQVREYMPAVLERARVIVAEVNADVPWTYGGPYLEAHQIDLLVEAENGIPDVGKGAPGEIERTIARLIAARVEDGATLQVGIGNLPDAVLAALTEHRDLGLHSGAVVDGVVTLAEAGILTNARKGMDEGIGIGGILMGSERLRRWAHRNPALQLRETDYTHHPEVLSCLRRFTAINSAIEVDLTGQINAEVAGGLYVGAVGGAADFLRGAARSQGGVPIIALPARAKTESRIVANLSGPVSTSRADAGLVVTEFGVADLRGQPLSRRVSRMIDIAAPEHRDALEREAHAVLRQGGAVFVAPSTRATHSESQITSKE